MSQPPGILHEIRWNEICPWLILVRALRVSLLLRVLLLAFIGVVLTQWGWATIEGVFSDSPVGLQRLTDTGPSSALPTASPSPIPSTQENISEFRAFTEGTNSGPLVRGWTWLTKPFVLLANRETSWQRSWVLSLCGVWAILVWSLFGGAISRIAAVYLTRGEILSPVAAMQAALAKWVTTAGAPIIALAGAAALALPLVLDGLFLRLDFVAMLAGLLWVLVLVWGLMLAVVLLGLMLGWPLMWATIGVERTDAFDGVSRCYAYIYQRPLHLAAYVLMATLLGLLGEMVVHYIASTSITLSEWTISWGAGNERTAQLVAPSLADGTSELSGMANTGAQAIQFWKWTLSAISASFPIAYLWPATVGIYLLLRRHIDSTEMDEVAFDDIESAPGLPGLTMDDAGVPQMDRASSAEAEGGGDAKA
ncbi:MAG: hypothetical protein GXP26_02450 [Planctomycetes bacterium]|nr:hypothetical protein [Planctomycetota bacterium]